MKAMRQASAAGKTEMKDILEQFVLAKDGGSFDLVKWLISSADTFAE
jgi:hypothetical protein